MNVTKDDLSDDLSDSDEFEADNDDDGIDKQSLPRLLRESLSSDETPARQLDAASSPELMFELLDEVGRGGYGSVWRARRRADDVHVACKRIPVRNGQEDVLNRVGMEVRMLKLCRDSAHVIQCLGVFLAHQEVWIVLELMDLGSLTNVMATVDRPFGEAEVARACAHMLTGLSVVHRNRMIHRDIKASNILFNAQGVCKLADFGTAATFDSNNQRHTTTGTMLYMAPELLNGQEQDQRCDVWSVGITCIELAQRRPPLADMAPLRAALLVARDDGPLPFFDEPSAMSPQFQAFVRRCLVRNRADRPFVRDLATDPFVQPLTLLVANDGDSAAVVQSAAQSKADQVLRSLANHCVDIVAEQQRNADQPESVTAQQQRLMDILKQLDEEAQGGAVPDGDWALINGGSKRDGNRATKEDSVLRASEGFVMIESPSTTPLPDWWPQSPQSNADLSTLVRMMRDPVHGLDIQDRSYRLRNYPSCFVGTGFVDWCMSQPCLQLSDRSHAIIIGQTLMFRGVIEHVVREHAFSDRPLFYHFTEDHRSILASKKKNVNFRSEEPTSLPDHLTSASLAVDPAGRRVERLITLMRAPQTGVKRRTRQVFLHRFSMSFAGSDIVSWLLFQRLGLQSRRAACEMLQLLMERGAFYPLTHGNRKVFKDTTTSLYRFYLDDDSYFPPACRRLIERQKQNGTAQLSPLSYFVRDE